MSKRSAKRAAPGARGSRSAARTGRPRDSWLWPVAGGIVLVGIVVNLVIVLATREPRTNAAGPITAASVEVSLERGAQLYGANCASCHGTDGGGYALAGVPAPALDATEHAFHHPDEQIVSLLRNGGTVMPAVGRGWTDDDLASVLAYVKQWWTPEQRAAQEGTIGE